MKAGPDRKHTVEFRDSAVRQVLDGARSEPQAARSLEMRGQPLAKRAPAQPVDDLQAECARLRQENARPRLEKEIVKKASVEFRVGAGDGFFGVEGRGQGRAQAGAANP